MNSPALASGKHAQPPKLNRLKRGDIVERSVDLGVEFVDLWAINVVSCDLEISSRDREMFCFGAVVSTVETFFFCENFPSSKISE